jgi:hypothetical protein
MIPHSGMLIYDHSTSILTHADYGDPQAKTAYWHGSLNYMKLGKGKGFLISLMGEYAPEKVPIDDKPVVNDEHGYQVSLAL